MRRAKWIEHERAMGHLYEAYTDGSCDNVKTKIGGSAYVIIKDGEIVKTKSKGFVNTTNNRMEMLAIISVVNSLPEDSSVVIYTDSKYCITAFDGNMHSANKDLIELFWKHSRKLKHFDFVWVKGHNGNEYNEMADGFAFDAYCEKSREMGKPITRQMYRTH